MTPPPVLQRLMDAVNGHDLDALAACFTPDFLSETPAHPDRAFQGRDQVRHNWAAIFRAVPDIQITCPRWSMLATASGPSRNSAAHGSMAAGT